MTNEMFDCPEPDHAFLFPNDDLSESLLRSIPRKVVNWLRDLEARYDTTLLVEHESGKLVFTWGHIIVSIDTENSFLSYGDVGADDYVCAAWDGHWDDPQQVRVTDLTLVEASIHLDAFVNVEKRFYDALEKLQKELEEKAPLPKMPSKYEREE